MDLFVRKRVLPLLFVIALFIVVFVRRNSSPTQVMMLQGTTMGPIPYHVKYISANGASYQNQVDSLLQAFNQSLSTYVSDSEISRFNKADSLAFESSLMLPVLETSKLVYEMTGGAFDPTVGPLVNAWGFGPNKQPSADTAKVDSLLNFVGFDMIRFTSAYAVKEVSGMYLDFSAVAKGYAVDLVGDFLASKSVSDYMVEIGGEVTCHGKNENGEAWLIGVDNPKLDITNENIAATVSLDNRAMATSGNYRNFYEVDGKKYAHTIDPVSGRPVQHSLLSASVFAKDCMTADALATACMVMGVEKAVTLFEAHKELDAILIYSGADGDIHTIVTSGIKANVHYLLFPEASNSVSQ
ncbi:MAG: FAD:protein FMN transferase [Imperialibacter sp.]|uniref:FAD:protein FMN transferase n=1 Tax=Imperialibacter sp. TaxID=2038411 RepID=UPI0032EEC788